MNHVSAPTDAIINARLSESLLEKVKKKLGWGEGAL